MAHPRPLLLPAPPEPFPGWINVQEVPGELGGALLVFYRNVLLWAETPAAERGTLPAGGGADYLDAQPDGVPLPDALAEAFRELRAVRTEPGQARPAAVSRACDAVSEWAEEEGHTGTALAWARAAASAYPPNVAAAHRVGIMARQRRTTPPRKPGSSTRGRCHAGTGIGTGSRCRSTAWATCTSSAASSGRLAPIW